MPETAADTRQPPGLSDFNSAEAEQLRTALRDCLAVRKWVAAVCDARPYRDADALLAKAREAAESLDEDDILAAIERHPRIGMLARASSATAAWSAEEQSGVDHGDTALLADLLGANQDYETRFGHIYLVCATGLSGRQILADMRERMSNEPKAELRCIREHLSEIAARRLIRVIGS